MLSRRLHDEFNPFRLQLPRRRVDVIAPQRDVQHAAGLQPIAEAKQDDPGVRAGNAEFEPALVFAERLIGEEPEPEHLGVEGERAVLVRDGNADELYSTNHGAYSARSASWLKSPLYIQIL